jgi:hypothetical protein
VLKPVQPCNDRFDVRVVAGEVVDLLEVRAEEPLVCVVGPLR